MTKAETERARYVFRVKEGVNCVFITPEPLRQDLKVFGNGFISFDLPAGTDYKKAQEVVQFLNDNIESIAYTWFIESV